MVPIRRALMILLACAATTPAQTPSPLAGKWYSYEWGGLRLEPGSRCLVAVSYERDYELVPDRKGMRGLYTSAKREIVFASVGECTHNGRPVKPVDLQARTWTLNGYGDAQPLRVAGNEASCRGFGCDAPDLDLRDFVSNLRREGTTLVETDEDHPEYRIVLRPAAAIDTETKTVREAAARVIAAFASGEPNKVAALITGTLTAVQRNALLDSVPTLGERWALIDTGDPIAVWVMDPPSRTPPPGVEKVAALFLAATETNGSRHPLNMLLYRERGEWRFVP